ncbi:MAG: serine/threonine-protein kinase [Verrucomicrobiota bacterium]
MSLVGQTIGNYKVVQQIGEGGMGVVYLAEHPVIGRKVAIKLLHATFAKDSETVARFFNEARAIHLIAHPNIVEILDFGQTTDGQPYFIMEFLSGESLADRIARGGVPPAEAVAIVSQICDALQAAHDKRIIHRDLKPHNVHLLGEGARLVVKILDFGVAKMSTGWDTAQSGGQSVKTRTGSLMGTPLYMSPEQCRGSGKLDHRTDIYSLAVILFEMISGRPPFVAEGVGELFAKHMLEPAPSLADFAPRTPPHIVRAVARALSKDLDDRYPTMKAFRDVLNGQPDSIGPEGARSRRAVAQPTTMAPTQQLPASNALGAEHTTLSSAVSEMEELDRLPTRNRKGLMIGTMLALGVVAVAFVAIRKNRTAAHPPVVAAPPPPVEPAPPLAPAVPETVNVKFEVEPAGAHVLRMIEGRREPEDVGVVPLELKLARADDPVEYLLRADGHKDRTINVDLTRDQVLHLSLEKLPVADKDKKVKAPPRPVKPHRPAVHDTDGLAVPSF